MRFKEACKLMTNRIPLLRERGALLAPLATRVVLGLAFVQTGMGKWQHFAKAVEYFGTLGIPFPTANAALVATLELVGGGALIVGLFTRFFAAGLTATMVVALATAERAHFIAAWGHSSESSPTDIAAFTFLLFLLWLVFYGPGALSLDALWGRLKNRGCACDRSPKAAYAAAERG